MNKTRYSFEGEESVISPQLVYYKEIIEENIQRMISYAEGPERLWPHVKTHKMAEVVKLQMQYGIDRFKCATIAEAEMCAAAGAKKVTLAYPLVGPNIPRFLTLAKTFPETEFFAISDCTEQADSTGPECPWNRWKRFTASGRNCRGFVCGACTAMTGTAMKVIVRSETEK